MPIASGPSGIIAIEQVTTILRAGSAKGRAAAADYEACVLVAEAAPVLLLFIGHGADIVSPPKLPDKVQRPPKLQSQSPRPLCPAPQS
jgi:hypothetical protein